MEVSQCSQIRAAERLLFDSGSMSSSELMERVILRLHQTFYTEPELRGLPLQRVVVYAGKGNNAGDALGLAALLAQDWDCPVSLRSVCPPEAFSPDSYAQYLNIHAPISFQPAEPGEGLLIIDGLLGSGAAGELRPAYANLVRELNELREASPRSLVLAIDIPTGLDAESGEVGNPCVRADITAPIGCVKPGMLADGAEDAVGRLLPIPLPEVEIPPTGNALVTDASLAASWLPRRPFSYFKNRAGRVHIIAGCVGYTGAARMCAEAAVQAGAGLVALYCKPEIYPILAASVCPEVMVQPVTSYAEVPLAGADCLLVGPGLGTPEPAESAALLRLLQAAEITKVLDADALNLLAREGAEIPPHSILTPHPGEFRRLSPESAGVPRSQAALSYATRHQCTLLLKGARSIITDGSGCICNSTGGPYMATGGQGDVLAGAIAAYVAQGVPAMHAAALGAYRCGLAAAESWQARGYSTAVPASSLLPFLG